MKTISASRTVCIGCATSPLDPYGPLGRLGFLQRKAGLRTLRENILRDLGATERALNNAEWKAATVLAGATIEALLLWRLQEPSPGAIAVQAAVAFLVGIRTIRQPHSDIERWELHQFIELPDTLVCLNRTHGTQRDWRGL
jgi:hypothetical protein